MSDRFHMLDEPLLSFGDDQTAEDPRDGLALFGPHGHRPSLPDHVVIGTQAGIDLWHHWGQALNSPAFCVDINRQRPWPPYPGFDAAFGTTWPMPLKSYVLDEKALSDAARKADRNERTYSVTNLYLAPVEQIRRLDAKPAVVVCVVPDEVYLYCRSQSYVKDISDSRKSQEHRRFLSRALKDRKSGQGRMFDDDDEEFGDTTEHLEQYGLSPDFRRQLKARMMPDQLPVQIIKESTLAITDQV